MRGPRTQFEHRIEAWPFPPTVCKKLKQRNKIIEKPTMPWVVVHAYNLSTQEAEAGESL